MWEDLTSAAHSDMPSDMAAWVRAGLVLMYTTYMLA